MRQKRIAMRSLILAAAVGATLMAARPAAAQQVVVNGGAPNQGIGWNIFDDNRAATSVLLGGTTSFDGIDFWGILPQSAPYAPDIFWQLVLADATTGLPGGTVAASGDAIATATLDRELDAFPGFFSWQFDLGIAPQTLSAGMYWLMLHDGIVNPAPTSLDPADGYTASNLIWETADGPGQSAVQTFDVSSDWSDAALGGLAFELTSSAAPVTATPEPATLVLVATGLIGVGGAAGLARRRRRKRQSGMSIT